MTFFSVGHHDPKKQTDTNQASFINLRTKKDQFMPIRLKSSKKSVFLFWLIYMAIRCEHAHRLELRMFLNFCVAHLAVKREIRMKCILF